VACAEIAIKHSEIKKVKRAEIRVTKSMLTNYDIFFGKGYCQIDTFLFIFTALIEK